MTARNSRTLRTGLGPKKKVPNNASNMFKDSRWMAGAYSRGEFPVERAIAYLSQKGVSGAYFSGEVALQQAANVPVAEKRDWIRQANAHFLGAAVQNHSKEFGFGTLSASKSIVRIAQMPVLAHLLLYRHLPDRQRVATAYDYTVRAAKHFSESARSDKPDLAPRLQSRIIGYLAEMAVLGLGQRHALRENVTNCWLPTQSLLRVDYGSEVAGSDLLTGYDISMWSETSGSPATVAYPLQVKSSPKYKSEPAATPYDPSIPVVHVMPDLYVPGSDPRNVASQIIDECYAELTPQSAANPAGTMLDRRTELFLSVIDPRH